MKKHNTKTMADHMRSQVKVTNRNRNTDYESIAQKYLDITQAALKEAVGISIKYNESINISQELLRKQLPEYTDLQGKKQYWFYWLSEHYPVYEVVQSGYSYGKNKSKFTRIHTMDINQHINPHQLYQETVSQLEPLGYKRIWVPISVQSLRNYVSHSEQVLQVSDQSGNYKKTVERNLVKAQALIKLAEYTQVQHNLPEPGVYQFLKRSEFGRHYAQGPLALDRLHSELREAALGNCYKYDIRCSVLAFYMAELERITGVKHTSKTSRIVEYIQNKRQIRHRLANLICNTDQPLKSRIDWVKQAITAMGFGASWGNTWFDNKRGVFQSNGIQDIIRNRADLAAFQQDSWVRDLMSEIAAVAKHIAQDYLQDPDLAKIADDLRETRGSGSKTWLWMAYLYQHAETAQIQAVLHAGHNEHRPLSENLLLTLHDGFYTRKPIAGATATELLRELNPYAVLERSDCVAYVAPLSESEQQHRTHIRTEEQLAAQYHSSWITQAPPAQHTPEVHQRVQAYRVFDQCGVKWCEQNRSVIASDAGLSPYYTEWYIAQAVPV